MDSPGNDLESIAGQVASGCNLIFFVTGNGSITNFPFVPTIKIVTTSTRYALLAEEMDVNAGAYLDGVPLTELAATTRDLALAVASGQRSAGEKAGHAQVQIWREWPLDGRQERPKEPRPPGFPLFIEVPEQTVEFAWQGCKVAGGKVASDRVGLILPASLCSGQIARLAAQSLNESGLGRAQGISRFTALAHTEGCGSSIEPELVQTLLGYMQHPSVATCLVLEHGCEISHNDFWRLHMRGAGLDPETVGWASIQRDGGTERVLAEIEAWFTADCARLPAPAYEEAGFADVSLGLMADGNVDPQTGTALAALTRHIAHAGGTVILPANDSLASNAGFSETVPLAADTQPTIAYGGKAYQAGFHLMANPTSSWAETMTGLGAAGAGVIIALCSTRAQQGHPFIPMLQVASQDSGYAPFRADMDLLLAGDSQQRLDQILAQLAPVLSRITTPKSSGEHNTSFQITRGVLGVSL
jgi:altronate dehydratase